MSRKRNRKSISESTPDSAKPNETTTDSATSKPDENSESKATTKSTNDPAWYMVDESLAKDGARIPFNVAFGSNIKDYGIHTGAPVEAYGTRGEVNSTPGVMTLFLKPSYGRNKNIKSPINVCAQSLYTFTRYMNSGRKNYDPADLMLYVMHFSDMYAFIMWGIRTYNLAFMYSQKNYYLGRLMLENEGWDVTSLVNNLANFRYMLNVIINKVASYVIPNNINMFKRRVFLYSNYYIENPYGNIKDQLYNFTPAGFYFFDLDSNGAGMLNYMARSGAPNSMTPATYMTLFDTMMSKVTGDEDFGIMSGDLLKAFGSNIIGLSSVPEEGGLIPTYDPIVLSQFKNASLNNDLIFPGGAHSGQIQDATGFDLTLGTVMQDTKGVLHSAEAMYVSEHVNNTQPITAQDIQAWSERWLSVENPDPDVGDVLEATRLTTMTDGSRIMVGGTYANAFVLICGSELVTSGIWCRMKTDGTLERDRHPWNYYLWDQSNITDLAQWGNVYNVLAYSNFKYAPMVWFIRAAFTWATSEWHALLDATIPASNLENVTKLDKQMLDRIHEIALISLCYVPGVAKLIS